MTDREYTLLAEIRALKADYIALQTDAAWQQRESARAIEAFQRANDVLADENADLVEQLAIAQSVVDGQAYRIQQLERDCRTYLEMAHEAMWNHVGFDDRVIRGKE